MAQKKIASKGLTVKQMTANADKVAQRSRKRSDAWAKKVIR